MPSLSMLMEGRGCPVRASSCDAATAIRSSPILRRWLPGTVPKRRLSIGAGGWSVPAAAAGGLILCDRDEAAPGENRALDAAPRQPLGRGRNAHEAERGHFSR
jgi:hypothetical protein